MTIVQSIDRPPSDDGTPPERRSRRRSAWGRVVATSALTALAAVAAGHLGSKVVYVLLGVAGVAIGLYSIRDLIGPPIADAAHRLTPAPIDYPALGPVRTCVGVVVSALTMGTLAFVVGDASVKVMYGVAALLGVAAGLWLVWPAIRLLFDTPPVPYRGTPRRAVDGAPMRAKEDEWAAVGLGLEPDPKPIRPVTRAVGMFLAVFAGGIVAFLAATMGNKALLGLVGGLVVVACLVKARNKTVVAVFGTACSMAFLLHKSFGPRDLTLSGGAPAIYVTSLDAMLLLLYALWVTEGGFVADVRVALHRRILCLPLLGALLMLPSLLAGGSSGWHALSELVRMGWMYLLFFYIAVRVRSRAMVWAILAGFGAFAAVEIIVIVLQWKTGGVLGLSFLGVPTHLTKRVTDAGDLGRPFGTIIHPVFMGAAMGSLGLVAFAFGLTLRRSLTKVTALALTAGCTLCLYLAHTRAALVAFVIVLLGMVLVALIHRHLQLRTIVRVVVALLIGAAIFFPQLKARFVDNFGSSHFSEEVVSRYQLNDLAGRMISDHPVIGVGLNNFEVVMGPYEDHGIIFADNPVHNVYLLYLAETGILGLAGVVVVGTALYNVALRLARSRDRLLGGVGLGVSAAMVFLMIEELLGFSLRQDVPLAIYWIFAGLAVACYRMAGVEGRGRSRQDSSRRRGGDDPRRDGDRSAGRVTATAGAPGVPHFGTGAGPQGVRRHRSTAARMRFGLTALVMCALLAAGLQGLAHAQGLVSVPIAPMRIVFSARRLPAPGIAASNGIYEVDADGSHLKPVIESHNNTLYNWSQWALGGTKIIYTVRDGPRVGSTDSLGQYENIWMMNPDGSGNRQLTDYQFRAVHPKVSPDGRSVLFTGQNPQYPIDATYTLDLLTLQATNLSQRTQPDGAADSDPKWTPDGGIVIASSGANILGAEIDTMNADGSNRQTLVNDGNFNTDPEFSPDRTQVAYAAFQGSNPAAPGAALDPANPDDVVLNPTGWKITVTNPATAGTATITQGEACDSPTINCKPGQSSAFKPVWSTDGKLIAWNGRLNSTTTCICVANANGSDPRVLVKSSTFVIKWFDWTAPGGQAPITAVADSKIGSKAASSRLLISAIDLRSNTSGIFDEPADMMGNRLAGTGGASDPVGGSWSQNRSEFVFAATASYDTNNPQYGPPPRAGEQVHEHFTLQQLAPALNPRYPVDGTSAQMQIFLRRSDGTVGQLTTPWTEDWRDAIEKGAARSNTDPVISPDGRYVAFTNHSLLTGESFVLRMDLHTGAVLNLTNGTAGALPVNDALPKWSPDSSKIAFTWTDGADTDVHVMNAADGTAVAPVTDDHAYDMDPAWSPDGRSIVFSQHAGRLAPTTAELESLTSLPTTGWLLVKVDVATGHETVLTTPADSPAWRPVFSPDGSRIGFIGWKYRTLDVFWTTPAGAPVQPLLITPLINETSVDWK